MFEDVTNANQMKLKQKEAGVTVVALGVVSVRGGVCN